MLSARSVDELRIRASLGVDALALCEPQIRLLQNRRNQLGKLLGRLEHRADVASGHERHGSVVLGRHFLALLRYMGGMPAVFTTAFHIAISFRMSLSNSAGELPTGS